ncbi:hypothetical protein HDU96_003642 [Phlyctochytrium bullatum]|nr:hypothetical protein HDU96_003642 [Phlyctochytrium bullatum]
MATTSVFPTTMMPTALPIQTDDEDFFEFLRTGATIVPTTTTTTRNVTAAQAPLGTDVSSFLELLGVDRRKPEPPKPTDIDVLLSLGAAFAAPQPIPTIPLPTVIRPAEDADLAALLATPFSLPALEPPAPVAPETDLQFVFNESLIAALLATLGNEDETTASSNPQSSQPAPAASFPALLTPTHSPVLSQPRKRSLEPCPTPTLASPQPPRPAKSPRLDHHHAAPTPRQVSRSPPLEFVSVVFGDPRADGEVPECREVCDGHRGGRCPAAHAARRASRVHVVGAGCGCAAGVAGGAKRPPPVPKPQPTRVAFKVGPIGRRTGAKQQVRVM